jgi:hypothetical protein
MIIFNVFENGCDRFPRPLSASRNRTLSGTMLAPFIQCKHSATSTGCARQPSKQTIRNHPALPLPEGCQVRRVWMAGRGRTFYGHGRRCRAGEPWKDWILRVMCCDLSQIKHAIPLPYSLPLFKKNNEHHQSSKLRGGWQPGLSLLTGASAPCPA